MSRPLHTLWIASVLVPILATGCQPTQPFYFFEKGDMSHYVGVATKLETPDLKTCSLSEVSNPPAPLSLSNSHYDKIWDLPLEEAVHLALENSKVMRTLGARFASQGGTRPQVGDAPTVLLSSPNAVQTTYDPGIIESNPTLGVEGALSSFDAELASSFTWEHDNTPQNSRIAAGSIQNRVSRQDIDTFITGITKRTAVGTTVGIQQTSTYTDSNSPLRESPHDNSIALDFTLTQRLLRGGGLLFNEIHGPLDAGTPGIGGGFNGVMIARINMDISLADFEAGVRNLVSDTENAYWELYFAYRALDAAKVGRDSALSTWTKIHALAIANARGGEADKEAQSRNQYFTFRAQVEQSLNDLYRMENRLRYLMGLAATDGRLIRPKDEPTTAHVAFEWCDTHEEALARSIELRREKWRIKQLELELVASKNLLLPNLDLTARYRAFGLGEDLVANEGAYRGTPSDTIIGTSATSSLADAPFGSFNLGLNFSMPFGFRRELTTIRNQQLLLVREKSVLQDQELELSHQIADAVRLLDTQYHLMQTNYNRRLASEQEVSAVEAAYLAGTVTLDLLLQAQQRRSDAESAYYRSLVDYNRGISQVHYVKGSLLEYNNVYLAEGPWPGKAYFDAHRLARSRDAAYYLNYGVSRPSVFSQGPLEQHEEATDQEPQGENVPPGKPTPAEMNTLPIPTPAATSDQPQRRPSTARRLKPAGEGPMLGSAIGSRGDVADISMAQRTSAVDTSGSGGWTAAGQRTSTSRGDFESDASSTTAQADHSASSWKKIQR